MNPALDKWLEKMPVVAIIRGVTPEQAVDIGQAIYRAGIGVIEVPLNSPDAFESIKRLNNALGETCIIGCGTCLTTDDVAKVASSGGKIVVTPNVNTDVIRKAIELGMTPMPGWATPTEAFAAYAAGARYLKLFPASTYGSGHIKAARAVLPTDTKILAVGGVGAKDAKEWMAAGINGFGIGSEIYKAGRSANDVYERSVEIVTAITSCS